jgi:hypothetical protein
MGPLAHISGRLAAEATHNGFDERKLAIYLGAVGLVVIVSGLVSGLVERGPISQVVVFVALGVLVGPWGFDVVNLRYDSPAAIAAPPSSPICRVMSA